MESVRDNARNNARDNLPLVFVHGSGDSARAWEAVVALLPERTCIALDLPGHGAAREEPGPERMSVSDYAQWVRTELARRDLSGVCLIGHSLGSAIAQRLAVDAAGLVRRVVLVGGGARLRVLPTLLEAARVHPDATRAQLASLGFAPNHAALRESHLAEPTAAAPGVLYRDLAACDAFDIMAELGHITQPTLIVTGEQDRLTPPKYATYLRDHLPHASLVLIPDAGHNLPVEAPDALTATITTWLRM
jgi:pimeloyl-ACP methyl ester carboxylesterase